MNFLITIATTILLTGCAVNPSKNFGGGILGIILGYVGWKILVHPSVIGGEIFLKIAKFIMIVSLFFIIA